MSIKRILAGVIVLAVVTRIIAALALGDSALPLSGAYDQVSYDMLAQRVLAGKGFSFPSPWYPFTAANEPTAHWSFLYTLYLASVYALFGHHPLAARLIQVLLSGLQCWLAYRVGRRLFGEWTGAVAALLTAGYAYFIFFSAALMTQTFYMIALLAALDIALDLSKLPLPASSLRAPTLKWLLLGVALGIGVLMRQTLLLFAPVLFIWLVWARRRNSKSTAPAPSPSFTSFARWSSGFLGRSMGLLPTVLVLAAMILPWTIHNYLVFHDFLLLNSNSGYWFYSSNHPNQGTEFNANFAAPIPDNLKGLSEPAIDRALLREGLGFIVADPLRFLSLTWSRIGAYFWVAPTEGSQLIANLSRLLSFGLYLPFMVYGLYVSHKKWSSCLPLYLYAAFDTGLCLISWSAPRYRLPTDALMMIFAGLAVADLGERIGVSKWFAVRVAVRSKSSNSGA